MWFLKSALSDQNSTINKLLSEGWEPFSVVGHLKKKDKPIFKIYFKKWEYVEDVDEPMVTATLEKTEPLDIEQLIKTASEMIGNVISDKLKEATLTHSYPLWTPPTTDPNKMTFDEPLEDMSENLAAKTRQLEEELSEADTTVERKEVLGNTKVELEEDRVPVAEGTLITGGAPEGDGFRVVDEVPVEITSSTARTTAQEEAIDKLRKQHNTNVTAFKPGSDGFVKVLVENWEYMIAPDGNWSKKDTGAKTSSLMVQHVYYFNMDYYFLTNLSCW